jgi:hypothetical protein
MSEKKRKRREDGGERPKKKVAIAQAPQGSVQVEILENKEILGPLLGMREAMHNETDQQGLIEIQLLLQASIFRRA